MVHRVTLSLINFLFTFGIMSHYVQLETWHISPSKQRPGNQPNRAFRLFEVASVLILTTIRIETLSIGYHPRLWNIAHSKSLSG